MAISALGRSTGTYIPLPAKNTTECRDGKTTWSGRTYYTYDFRFKKEDPVVLVKWLRANMGQRGSGWDFILNASAGTLTVEIWEDKLKFMYEMWRT
jgi:hypothetical protein